MACSCGKGRVSQNASRGIQFVYDFYANGVDQAEEPIVFGTPLEAKRAVRTNGGGTIKRRQVGSAPAA